MPPPSLIPQPFRVTPAGGEITLGAASRIFAGRGVRGEADFLAAVLRRGTGFRMEVANPGECPANDGDISLELDPDLDLPNTEGYFLTAAAERPVVIRAKSAMGIARGIQTLLQLLPPAILGQGPYVGVEWKLPCVTIEDHPRFAWRGAMLDSVRHFQPKEFIKKFLDLLALHKLNTFHWHLTDDQGWRIEIKKYPRLTEVGSRRRETMLGHLPEHRIGDGRVHQGFYTQEEAREIVAYAAERHITIVPEIEMPGHCQAAIAAYPELGCTQEPVEVGTEWGFHCLNIFNPAESTISFLQDVLGEVMEIFPGQFIHVGGDEAVKTQWEASTEVRDRMKEVGAKDCHELQSWFIRRMADYLSRHGRRLVGWDEILEGGLAPDATVMSWRGIQGGITAAQAGHDAVMAPTTHTYFDYYQSEDLGGEPLALGGFLPLEVVYAYDPVPVELTPKEAAHILGVQGQLWTECMPTPDRVEYMAFPRLCALAEVGWSPSASRDYGSFRARLQRHLQRLNVLGVRYRPPENII